MAPIRYLTAGESHGPKLVGIIEGLPAGFAINKDLINDDLRRRQQGFGRGGRMKIEKDEAHLVAGVVEGKTTGAPVAVEIINRDYDNWQHKDIAPMSIPRPGHADFAGATKYRHDDLRLSLERASARETAMRVALGSIAKQMLMVFDINVLGYVVQVGSIIWEGSPGCAPDYHALYRTSLENEFAFPDSSLVPRIKDEIFATMKAKDTLGGVLETVVTGLIPGLGSYVHYDRRLDGRLAEALMSIPAMKAVEIGCGIKNASLRGTEVHDEFALQGGNVTRTSNRAGGLEGGMTNGQPLVLRTYMKPISTTLDPRASIDLATTKMSPTLYERSDFCAVQRAAVVGEAVVSLVMLDALIEKTGGDSKSEMMASFENVLKGKAGELSMKKDPWRFNYDQ